jgi:hypothetical protein
MKIFFTYSKGDLPKSVNDNYDLAKSIIPETEKILGKSTILDTYRYLSSLADKEFVWIDSDNVLKPEAIEIFNCIKPSILYTTNEYGLVYGHGGIKRCEANVPIRDGAIDVTYYLGLTGVEVIGSFHGLGDGWIKYRAIFVEMLKCALKNDMWILTEWIRVRPDIWAKVENLLKTSNIDIAIDLIRNRASFERYYEDNLCSDL